MDKLILFYISNELYFFLFFFFTNIGDLIPILLIELRMLFKRGKIVRLDVELPMQSILGSFVGNVLARSSPHWVNPMEIIQAKVRDLRDVLLESSFSRCSPSHLRFKS